MSERQHNSGAKVCVICGVDCSHRPRIKDRAGRYACLACVKDRKRRKEEEQSGDLPNEIYAVAAGSGKSEAAGPCPECGRLMGALVSVCGHCGYDRELGTSRAAAAVGVADTQVKDIVDDGPLCTSCGYSLRGLTSSRCPECGEPILPRRKRQLYEDEQITRREYIKPLVMLVIGAGLVAVIELVRSGEAEALYYLLGYLIHVPIGVGVFFFLCLIWIGFDAPLHLTALRLAGIYAVVDLVLHVSAMIPGVAFFAWLIGIATYVGLLSDMLELELIEAAAVAIITFVVKMTIALVLLGIWLSEALNGG